MRDGHDQPRRYLIATAFARYWKAPQWDRPGLVEAREQIIRLFTRELGYEHVSGLGLDPGKAQLTDQLRDFCRDPVRRPDDLVAVYIGGHGEVLDATREHVLLTSDTDPDDLARALPTAELARSMLLDTGIRRVLLMLDTCYSAHGGNELTAAAITSMTSTWGHDDESGLVVIASAHPAEQAETGAFPRLLQTAVDGLPVAGHNPDSLPLDSVVKAMNANAGKPSHQHIGITLVGLTGEIPPFLPNPRRDRQMTEVDLAIQQAAEWQAQGERRDAELRTRLLVRAMGGHDGRSWWFAGRHEALRDITAWLHTPSPDRPLLAVTGDPGSGKTAVLGLIAAVTQPDRRNTVPLHALGLPPAAVPAVGAVDVAIYAQSLTTDQVFRGIAAAAQVHAASPGQLLDQLSGRQTPLTVLIDAIDEAADPDDLARRLLHPLAEHAAGRLRFLLGTRPYLLDRLGQRRESSANLVDLDADRYADPVAMTAYAARGLLDSNSASPYRHESPQLLRAVADAVAATAHPSFLVARITSTTLAAQERVADPQEPKWRSSLPRYPGEAMRRDLQIRLGDNAGRARDLLRPLAFAEGQGLPWEDIWAAVATEAAGTAYSDDDLLWLRRTAGSYVVEAIESGRSTYRLYHQALAEHLRAGTDPATMQRAIAAVLARQVPRDLDGLRDWARSHPYTLRHLASHAAAAGELDRLITDPDYLVNAEPETLLHAIRLATGTESLLIAAIYRCSADLHRTLPPQRRRHVLCVDAARFTATRLHRELAVSLAWPPRWATGQQTDHALRTSFGEHNGPVSWVTCGSLDGRSVAVTACADGARVWNLATGTEIARSIGFVSALAVSWEGFAGRPVAVSGGQLGEVRVWDLATAKLINTFGKRAHTVEALACGTFHGQPCVVTGSRDETARAWDLESGEEISQFTQHTGKVIAVACGVLDGRPVAVSGSWDRTARVWDLMTGSEIRACNGHDGPVDAVAWGVLAGQPVVVTGSRDYTARVWNPKTGEEIIKFTGHIGHVDAVACGELDGRAVAVSGSRDFTARVWDLETASEIVGFTGHSRSVMAVAYGVLEGQSVVVTGGGDATARVWRVDMPSFDRPNRRGHLGDIVALSVGQADGHPVVVTGSYDGTARVWDLTTGEERLTFGGHNGPVDAVACGDLDGRPVAVSGSYDGTARMWDPVTGDEVIVFEDCGGSVAAVACGRLGSRLVVVTGTYEGSVRVWDPMTGSRLVSVGDGGSSVGAVACGTFDGRSVVVTGGDDRLARVWDCSTGRNVVTFAGHHGSVTAVTCGVLNGRPVAVTASSDRTAKVWDLVTARELVSFGEHAGAVAAVACGTIDGRAVAVTTGADQTVRLWDLATAVENGVFDHQCVGPVAFGPTGEIVIASGWDLVVLERRPFRAG